MPDLRLTCDHFVGGCTNHTNLAFVRGGYMSIYPCIYMHYGGGDH